MCYSIEIPSKEEISEFIDSDLMNHELDNAIRNDEWNEYFHRMSGFTHSKIPVLTSENPERVQSYNWGLIPKWCKDEAHANDMRKKTLNAKSETVFELPSFKASISKKRCLVFVKGFYEWRDFNKQKYPYYIHLKDQPVFTMGGIYECWHNKDMGEMINSISVITTEANSLMAEIHNSKKRMPLILTGNSMNKWIDPKINIEEIKNLMKPLDERLMTAHTISKLITSKTEDSNQLRVKEKFIFEELPEITNY